MQRNMFRPPNSHAESRLLESIEVTDPLPIHQLAFAPQEYQDSQIDKSRTGVS